MQFATIDGGEGLPEEPDWASLYTDVLDLTSAHEHWLVALRDCREAQTVTAANGHALRRLVEFRVQYDRAARQVAENGPVLKAKRTRVPQYNPQWVVMRQADEAIRALEGELGIAPVRRGKAVKVQRAKPKAAAADRYLRAAG